MQKKDGEQLELFDFPHGEASLEDYKVYDEIADEVRSWYVYLDKVTWEKQHPVKAYSQTFL